MRDADRNAARGASGRPGGPGGGTDPAEAGPPAAQSGGRGSGRAGAPARASDPERAVEAHAAAASRARWRTSRRKADVPDCRRVSAPWPPTAATRDRGRRPGCRFVGGRSTGGSPGVSDLTRCSARWMFSMDTSRMKSACAVWWSKVSSARCRMASAGSRPVTSTACSASRMPV
ncbi:hypothetical protein SANTM175S_00005 [Streptomyces antimycoticus]